MDEHFLGFSPLLHRDVLFGVFQQIGIYVTKRDHVHYFSLNQIWPVTDENGVHMVSCHYLSLSVTSCVYKLHTGPKS